MLARVYDCLFSRKTWFKNKHFSDADADKPDTRFELFGNATLEIMKSHDNHWHVI